ncbi:MAG TPA: hypothetical protein VM489_02890 [Burkholderiales bacterium]|nr:hypothetical protein [Burkholderiales bacterium]
MSSKWPDAQPLARVVGRRIPEPVGVPPSARTRAAMDALGRFASRAPKGVFRYASHEEMRQDRERWTAEAMAEIARARG